MSDEDDAGDNWMAFVAREWHEELSDARQDIYSLADGVPIDGSSEAHMSDSNTSKPQPS
jgi:hypothetical protein